MSTRIERILEVSSLCSMLLSHVFAAIDWCIRLRKDLLDFPADYILAITVLFSHHVLFDLLPTVKPFYKLISTFGCLTYNFIYLNLCNFVFKMAAVFGWPPDSRNFYYLITVLDNMNQNPLLPRQNYLLSISSYIKGL